MLLVLDICFLIIGIISIILIFPGPDPTAFTKETEKMDIPLRTNQDNLSLKDRLFSEIIEGTIESSIGDPTHESVIYTKEEFEYKQNNDRMDILIGD